MSTLVELNISTQKKSSISHPNNLNKPNLKFLNKKLHEEDLEMHQVHKQKPHDHIELIF